MGGAQGSTAGGSSEIAGSEHVLCFDGVGSEHLLVGLLIDERELVAQTLTQHGLTVEVVKRSFLTTRLARARWPG